MAENETPTLRRRYKQPLRRRILEMLWDGQQSPPEILRSLRVSARALAPVLQNPYLRRDVELLQLLAVWQAGFARAQATKRAIEQLGRLAEESTETARKAALNLVELARQPVVQETEPVADGAASPARGRLERQIERMLTHLAGDGSDGPADSPAQEEVDQ